MRNDKVFPTLCMLVALACWLVVYAVWQFAWGLVGFLAWASTPALTWTVEVEDAPTPKGKQVTADELREAFQ